MVILLKSIIFQIVLAPYVFRRGWQLLPANKVVCITYTSVFVGQLIIYLTAFFGYDSLPQATIRPIALTGMAWSLLMMGMAIALFAYDIFSFANKKYHILSDKINLDSKKIRVLYFILLLAIAGILFGYGYYSFRQITITEQEIHINKRAGHIKDMRVAVVSDFHLGIFVDKATLKTYVDKIMEQQPDMILIVGDVIDYHLGTVVEQRMDEDLAMLKAPYGVYMINGNHEYMADDKEKMVWLQQFSNITYLRDSALLVNNAFYIVGRDDKKNEYREPISSITKDLDKSKPIILLNHQPHDLHEDVDAGADIALYGHTHNGQIFPYNLYINMVFEVGYGYKKKGNTHIYVSSGIGTSGPLCRIGTLTEILMLNIHFSE